MNKPNPSLIKKYTSHKKELKLLPRYLHIFEFRNGLTDGEFHTQAETGRKFNISATRVYQMMARLEYELEKLDLL
jgi:DNA-directed RNA polymerase sigma subunit (sigma70/sigma32)